jgi:hypothetical protein
LTATDAIHLKPAIAVPRIDLRRAQTSAVWLMMASSFVVTIEPAPCDFLFLVALAAFLWRGLYVTAAIAPLILYLLLYNLGGFISFLEVSNERKAVMFVITSAYMAVTGIFFAYYVAYDPVPRFAVFRNGYILGAIIASILGIIGYFNFGGLGSQFAEIGRAQGLFKDPNVFSTYIILPALMLIQGFMLGTQRWRLLSGAGLLVILAAIFLAFSRGAWISFVSATALMVVLTFMLTSSTALRSRIIVISIMGLIAAVGLLAILLSIPEVKTLFLDRFTLIKYYDAGETGRFGNQINSIPILLQRPLGFGPTYFRQIFRMDPHNVYLNAFSSYGWLGGISYFLLVISSIIVGLKAVFSRTPWQHLSIVVFCPMFTTMLQGVQIDTDHWRHFYWLVGMMWGLYAASAAWRPPLRAPT